jgi:hypothetical protein
MARGECPNDTLHTNNKGESLSVTTPALNPQKVRPEYHLTICSITSAMDTEI